MKLLSIIVLLAFCGLFPLSAAPVIWVDWISGTPGDSGTAFGQMTIGSTVVDVNYSGQIQFIQTNGGTNFYIPDAPYISALVDNPPPNSDIIALSKASTKTLTFSQPIDNLFFAIVSLNGNGYQFNEDFDIVSTGCGYWGCGGLKKEVVPGGFQANSTGGEPHGVIRFTRAVSSITWTSLTNENWNGFTVGTYGLAPPPNGEVPEPATCGLMLVAAGALGVRLRKSH